MNEIWLLLRTISYLNKQRIHTQFNRKEPLTSTHLRAVMKQCLNVCQQRTAWTTFYW